MDISKLPILGFLEQTVADALIRALSSLGNFKPKYPFMKIERAAAIYLALYLKGTLRLKSMAILTCHMLATNADIHSRKNYNTIQYYSK